MENEIKSQNGRIRAHLEKGGKLTAFEALVMFGSLRLSGRIHDLRNLPGGGLPINSQMVKVGKKRVAEYSLGV